MKKHIYDGILAVSCLIILYIVLQQYSHSPIKDIKEREFVIVIPSYNNNKWYKKNLDSVLLSKL